MKQYNAFQEQSNDLGFDAVVGAARAAANPLESAGPPAPIPRLQYPYNIKKLEYWIKFSAVKREKHTRDSNTNSSPLATILLPVPSHLGTGYKNNWDNETVGVLGRVGASIGRGATHPAEVGQDVKDLIGSIRKGSAASAQGIFRESMKKFGYGYLNFASSGESGSGLQGLPLVGDLIRGAKLGAGMTGNPHRAMLFNNVDFRTHRFEYALSAQNAEESEQIRQIIFRFKYHAAPDLRLDTQFFGYPDEFDITFNHPDFLFTIAPSVLTSFVVNYHGQDHVAYFKDTHAPVSVTIAMEFTELTIITKSDIMDRNR